MPGFSACFWVATWCIFSCCVVHCTAFVVKPPPTAKSRRQTQWRLFAEASSSSELKRIPPDLEGVPIPFVDTTGNKFIECYADSTCTVNGVTYTIAVPCDYAVALCYSDNSSSNNDDDQLIPVELEDDKLMDDLFPVAARIVEDEFGEELVLQRTPQTLTLVGELEEEEEEVDDESEEGDDDEEDDEEEVEVLLSFEHRGKEFHLVRLLDPILLVGKQSPDSEMDVRVLLTPEESEKVMPILEDLFLKFHSDKEEDDNDDPDDISIES